MAVAIGGAAPVSAAYAGGTQAPSTASGGAEYGAVKTTPPVAKVFSVAPRTVTSGGKLPSIRVRVDQLGSRSVTARVVLWPRRRNGQVVRIELGRIRTGRTVSVKWPKKTILAAGSYTLRLHATGAAGRVLKRTARASGRVGLTVRQAPAPKQPVVAPPLTAPAPDGGVFPVQGPHSYGDGLGADREDHRHQGVDLPAAEGTPVVAPLPGTITSVDFQKDGAGHYVVETLPDGRAFFFAHCKAKSIVVAVGMAVTAGTHLCGVGSTGASSGPHLHFEVWENGWRVDKRSKPIDPLPLLRSWDR